MRMRLAIPLLVACSLSAQAASGESRLKQVWYPSSLRSLSPDQLAQEFLNTHYKELGVPADALKLLRSQESLLAYHLVYQQYAGNLPIANATIALSISKNNPGVYQYHTNLTTQRPTVSLQELITSEEAYDAAWAYVGVKGEIFQAPQARLQYKFIEGTLRLVYSVDISATEPYGAWQIDVDATSRSILQVTDLRINEKNIPIPSSFGSKVKTLDRQAAFARYARKMALAKAERPMTTQDGEAKVFDPDPKTETGDTALSDKSPASAFEAAYVQRILPDLSYSGSMYALKGPWVQIIDFDPPTAAPSSTKDGKWDFIRGQGGFTDAMTYFHIDQSQRYIQSLGFKDNTGIQFRSIEADADGANGDDNSYFMPSTGRLAFGHGCVDDNEDADVILHEYGHALHFSINPNWGGGDTGAMGEGFGDYWASSYSYSTPKGRYFQPQIVYNWDAGNCWPGRSTDAINEKYSSASSYGAHQSLASGRQSDELWSTPLFQAHLALRALDVPREEIDTIILEAQFGLGSNLTMRQMAESIVLTAKRLYPDGPHAEVFRQKFLAQNILIEPTANLTATLGSVTDDDGIVDPGETVTFPITIKNSGDATAEGVTAALSSNDTYISGLTSSLALGTVADGAAVTASLSFTVDAQTPCGQLLALQVVLKNAAGKSWTVPLAVQVGRPLEAYASSAPNLPIPDQDSVGIKDVVELSSSARVSPTFAVEINIKHSYKGDLGVSLISPEGKTILLHDHTGSSDDDIIGTYPKTLTPKESLSGLLGQTLEGPWTLKVQDSSASDTGTLISWGIRDVRGYECR